MNVWGKFSEGGKWFFLILKQHQFLKYLDCNFLFSAAIFCFSPKNAPFWTFTTGWLYQLIQKHFQIYYTKLHYIDLYGPLMSHSDHRAGAVVDIVTEYEVQLGSLQIQMKFYLEKMKLR